MGYGDLIPSGGYHPKKALTKKQLAKMREGYEKGDMIAAHISKLEDIEHKKIKKEATKDLDSAFL